MAISFREAAEPYIDAWGPFTLTRDAVSETAIRRFCEVAEDGNPVYWDDGFASQSRFGRVIAPPQSLFSMCFRAWWTPEHQKKRNRQDAADLSPSGSRAVERQFYALCDEYGYTVNTVATQEAEYIAPFGPGDGRLKSRNMITDVSEEKKVHVGRGVFVTSVTEYRTEIGDRLVGRSTLVLLRYRPEGAKERKEHG